jgi:hypothetical protein
MVNSSRTSFLKSSRFALNSPAIIRYAGVIAKIERSYVQRDIKTLSVAKGVSFSLHAV